MEEVRSWSSQRLSCFMHIYTSTKTLSELIRLHSPSGSTQHTKTWSNHIVKHIVNTAFIISQNCCPVSFANALLVMLSLCLCPVSAATTNMLQCPGACTCYSGNSIPPSTGALMSIDCSGLGFSKIEIIHNLLANNSDKTMEDNIKTKVIIPDLKNNMLMLQVQALPVLNSNQLGVQNKSFFLSEVRVIDLSRNQLQSLQEGMFSEFQSLDYLNLSHNNISEIENTTFTELVNLQLLDLSFNSINMFTLDHLYISGKLSQLLINNNNIQLKANSSTHLFHFPQLTTLDISNNPLRELPQDFGDHFPYLKSLNLANCSIQEINNYPFHQMKYLEILNLNSNNITLISQPLFQNTALKWLSISSMPHLTILSQVTFYGLSTLEYLNLSYNTKINWIQPELFAPLEELKFLDLSHSGIHLLSEITFFNNKNLQKIFLNNNPFLCSCVNAWLAQDTHIDYSKIVNGSSLECVSEKNGTVSILEAEIKCQEIKVQNMSSAVSVQLGSKMLLNCQYESEEAAVIKWTTPSGAVYYHHLFYTNASQHMISPQDIQPDSDFHTGHYWHDGSSYHSELATQSNRIMILSDGSLYIDYMMRSDPGTYTCLVSNQFYNQSASAKVLLTCKLSGEVKIYAIIFGLICALTFFTLNLIYVIVSWTARRLVNKRRREIISQMLENLNVYKTTQIGRIHENYTHQLARVRNQYHIQRDRLHKNYASQVIKMKRGCSNQVEKVRENYNSKLHQLRDYSSNQIVQIRERANNQIVRIRDYGSNQLDKLRETYKLQQQHVLKLLDTMNLDNCRHVVETECMRTESMMYDIDLLGDDDRTDSPSSQMDSEYATAASSPAPSLEGKSEAGFSSSMAADHEISSTSSSDQNVIIEMQTRVDLEPALTINIADTWRFNPNHEERHVYSMKVLSQEEHANKYLLELESETSAFPQDLELELQSANDAIQEQGIEFADSDSYWECSYATPESSPVKNYSISPIPNYKLKERGDRETNDNHSPENIHAHFETNV